MAAQAAAKAKTTVLKQQCIRDVWTARMSVQYKEARRVQPIEVATVLKGLEWEPKYKIPGKNTHVRPSNSSS